MSVAVQRNIAVLESERRLAAAAASAIRAYVPADELLRILKMDQQLARFELERRAASADPRFAQLEDALQHIIELTEQTLSVSELRGEVRDERPEPKAYVTSEVVTPNRALSLLGD